MNGKKAKVIRNMAREASVGQPSRHYMNIQRVNDKTKVRSNQVITGKCRFSPPTIGHYAAVFPSVKDSD